MVAVLPDDVSFRDDHTSNGYAAGRPGVCKLAAPDPCGVSVAGYMARGRLEQPVRPDPAGRAGSRHGCLYGNLRWE